MGALIILVVIGTTVWVGIDASNLGVQKGRLAGSSLDMSVASWVVCCLLLWVVAFPCYLVARSRYTAMRSSVQPVYAAGSVGPAPGWSTPSPQYMPTTPFAQTASAPQARFSATPTAAPPQMSPDGRWWWDGTGWVAVPSPPPPPATPSQ